MAFADPLPEKGYARRGWVTFSSEVNIKDICAKLAATKVRLAHVCGLYLWRHLNLIPLVVNIVVSLTPLVVNVVTSLVSPDQRPTDLLSGEQGVKS